MYAAVPSNTPVRVAATLSVGEFCIAFGRFVFESFGQPKIKDLCLPVVGQLHVRRLQVATNDAALVRVLKAVGDLLRDRQSFVKGERTLLDSIGERWSFDQLHHKCACAVRLFYTIDVGDIRMIE
jgi:hypothetical protein